MAFKVLRKNWQFRRVYRQGEKVVGKYSVVFILQSGQDNGAPAFGFVASKRVGNAVQRNKAKRLLREAARQVSKDIIQPNYWIVLVAKSAILGPTYSEIASDLQDKLVRAEYLK
jgi:ribonuclease P protein component